MVSGMDVSGFRGAPVKYRNHAAGCARVLLILSVLLITLRGTSATLIADQSPAPLPRPQAQGSPSPTPSASTAQSVPLPQASAVIGYLGSVISWYRDRNSEARLALEPAEALFVTDNRRIADSILNLAFEAARAQAAVINAGAASPSAIGAAEPAAKTTPLANQPAGIAKSNGDGAVALAARQSEAQALVAKAKSRVQDLQGRLARASGPSRGALQQALTNAQAQLQLEESRLEAISAIAAFETNNNFAEAGSPDTLTGQIDELQRSAAPLPDQQPPTSPVPAISPGYSALEPAGLLANGRLLVRLARKDNTLQQSITQTAALSKEAEQLRAPLAQAAGAIYDQAIKLANQASAGDYATVREKNFEFQRLIQLHKLVVPAFLPLAKQIVLLNLYASNLERWRSLINDRIKDEIRNLTLRLVVFALLFAIVAGGAVVWRRLTFRYVQDFQRRQILMQMRRVAVGLIVALILIFGFASELSTLGTIVGFAAAGIALALQNVILSLAGYFYVSGRFGIRVTDRIELSGISGDVLEMGLFRLTLMELGKDDFGFQPTGRIVVFPNSVVFQPNGNFFKQLPGSSFIWNELRLTLAPDCDYRLVEKKLLEVVNDVFAQYRDSVQREYHNAELELNVRFDMPKPLARIELRESGLAMLIRYPVPMQSAPAIADEIARRLVDAIRREPGLELATQGTPSLRPSPLPPAPSEAQAGGSSDARKA